ncbi:tyrosinase family protein [Labrenzia sp. PHM005]|uniref:tyrosinase family protein n=1 Tax=Labrenzia sp. PHM005 TaxID=2590016 RepID=UPI001140595D|nr:tyrosinase family protein [Labrenzia sp. PHM005]QDG76684.1 tyrosinase family protein [Labrenzia sp. PHM005]
MITRRKLMTTAALSGAALTFSGVVPGVRAVAYTGLPVRRSLGGMPLDDKDLSLWRDFVGHMKGISENEPVSWIGFANIHGTSTGGFNKCPHGDWYFLPWHRGYVSMYEQAVRDWSGEASFAMPYWDWTTDRQIPKAYSDQTYNGQPNPLYDATRTMSATASLPDNMVGQNVITDILAETEYQVFGTSKNPSQNNLDQSWIPAGGGVSGPLEANPHNRVHCAVGGQMCSAVSARDPLFFMHHGNIDRLWALWNSQGRQNTEESLWTDMPFANNFRKMDGADYTVITGETQAYESLGYTYNLPETSGLLALAARVRPGASSTGLNDVLAGRPAPEGVITQTKTNFLAATALNPLDIAVPVSASQVAAALGESPQSTETLRLSSQIGDAPKQVIAILRDVPAPAADTAEYRVFVNCDYLSLEVPDTDPHYVTTFGFFGLAGDHAGHGHGGTAKEPSSYLVNLTGALQRLARRGQVTGDDIVVQVLAYPRQGVSPQDAAPIVPGSVEVAIV